MQRMKERPRRPEVRFDRSGAARRRARAQQPRSNRAEREWTASRTLLVPARPTCVRDATAVAELNVKATLAWREFVKRSGACGTDYQPDLCQHQRAKGHKMTGEHPEIDFANLPTPDTGFVVTLFLTVRHVAKSCAFYADVLGGQVVLDENPCIVKLANSWIIMNPGGGPTPDKPDTTLVNLEPGNTVSSFMNLRVADVQDCYETWRSRGAEFLTPPIDRGPEIRCYMRDPDGYLIEVGQATGLLDGELAKKRPEDLPG